MFLGGKLGEPFQEEKWKRRSAAPPESSFRQERALVEATAKAVRPQKL